MLSCKNIPGPGAPGKPPLYHEPRAAGAPMMPGYPKATLASAPPKASPPAPRSLAPTFSLEALPPATPGSQAPTLPDTVEEPPQTPEEPYEQKTPPIEVPDETPLKQLPDNQEGDSQLYPAAEQNNEKEVGSQAPQPPDDADARSEKSLPDTVHFPNPNSPVPSPSSVPGDQSPRKSEEQIPRKTPPCEEETESKNSQKKKAAPPPSKSNPPDEYTDGSYWKILGLDCKTIIGGKWFLMSVQLPCITCLLPSNFNVRVTRIQRHFVQVRRKTGDVAASPEALKIFNQPGGRISACF